MPTITFKAKPHPVYKMDGDLAYMGIKVPAIKRHHCDMPAFRSHPKYGSYANSDLFQNMLKRDLLKLGIRSELHTDCLPDCVSIEDNGFLNKVTITLKG